MNQLILKFPIQLFTERFAIFNEQELFDTINHYNGKKTIYYSIYSCQEKKDNTCNCNQEITDWHFCNANIDKIVFDIDNLNSLEIIKKFHKYLLHHNLKHLLLFSGSKGFHVYIFTNNIQLKTPKNALLNAHNYFIQQLNLKVNGNGNSDVDSHILGDISRLMRYPNTLHMDSKLYCIPLITEDLVLGKNHIMNKAKQQNFKFTYYGTELLDMKQFDNGVIHNSPIYNFEDREKIQIYVDKQQILNELPPCLQNMLLQPYTYWGERYHILRYMIDNGYGELEVKEIMKSFLSDKKHPIRGTSNYKDDIINVHYKFLKKNNSLFSCKRIKKENRCPVQGLCDKIKENPIYL